MSAPGGSSTQSPITFQTSTGAVVPPTQAQNGQSALNNPGIVDNTPSSSTANDNGSMMQPANAYNAYSFSGIPASSRPMGYVAPQSQQEDVE